MHVTTQYLVESSRVTGHAAWNDKGRAERHIVHDASREVVSLENSVQYIGIL